MVQCGRLAVPLDRSGAVAGTVRLAVRRLRPGRGRARGVVIALAGGPGQAAIPFLDAFDAQLDPLLGSRDLVVFDQRGTGSSGLLRCAPIERLRSSDSPAAAYAACAARLGPRRAFYTSRDSADDIEAIRRALGVPRVTLYGVSYGTKVAAAYAARHPGRVERLILDSVVTPEGPDTFQQSTFAGARRVLRRLCRGQPCRSLGIDPPADLARMLARVRQRPLVGTAVDGRGRRRRLRIGEASLLNVVVEGDLNPALRADLASGLAAALAGDPAQLLRAVLIARGEPVEPADLSPALFAATVCEEQAEPWPRGAPLAGRAGQVRSAVRALASGTFAPFSEDAVLAFSVPWACRRWPEAPARSDPGRTALPAVPTLILNGTEDVRTPVEDARAVARRIPGARLVEVPRTGHATLGGDTGECAAQAVEAFARQRRPPRCADRAPDVPIRGPVPASLGQTRPFPGVSGRRGRTLLAAVATYVDTLEHALFGPQRGGGLRGGSYRISESGIVALRGVVLIPGVAVSGTIAPDGVSLRVGGASAARGTVRLRSDGAIVADLGGRRTVVPAGRASAAQQGLGLAPDPLARSWRGRRPVPR